MLNVQAMLHIDVEWDNMLKYRAACTIADTLHNIRGTYAPSNA